MIRFSALSRGLSSLVIIFALSATNLLAQDKSADKQYYMIDALRHYHIGSQDEAKQKFELIVAQYPDCDAARYYLSNIYFRKGDVKTALEQIKKAMELDPSNYWYKVQAARLYSISGDLAGSAAIYESIRKDYPRKTELYDDMIDVYVQQKQFSKALDIINDIERTEGKTEGTVLTRFNILVFDGKKDEALKYLQEWDKTDGTPRSATIIGDYYATAQTDSVAYEYYMKALKADPAFIPASFGLAEVYRVRKQYDLYFERLYPFMSNSNIDPNMKVNYIKEVLANPQFVQTFLPQIDTIMQNLYGAHPKDSTVAYTFASYMAQLEKNDVAKQVFKKNAENYPDSKNAQLQYLLMFYYDREWQGLIDQTKIVMTKFPNQKDLVELLGIAQFQNKSHADAVATFDQLLNLAKGDSSLTVRTLALLGDLYYEMGDKKNSYKYYEKTLKFEPNHLPSLNNYAYYLSLEGKKMKKAYEMSKKTVDAEPENATYLDTFGWILFKMGKYMEAKAIFKQTLLYGGKENADILDHYAETLFKLKEYDLAFIYWDQAKALDPSLGIDKKIEQRKKEMTK